MKQQDFINKYLGQSKGYPDDSQYKGECLSIVKLFIKEVYGILPPPSGSNSAYGYWSNFPSPLGSVFTKIKNDPGVVPSPFDIVIWSPTASNSYGHISICKSADPASAKFISWDQNWNSRDFQETSHLYTNVIGWLHPTGVPTSDTIQLQADLAEQQKQVSNLQTQVNGLLENIKAWESKYNECDTQRIEAGASADGFRKQLNELVAKLAQILGTRQEVPEIIASIETAITFEDKAEELTRRIELEERDHREAVSGLEAKIKALESNLASVKADLQAVKDGTVVTPPKQSIISYMFSLFRR